MEHRILENKNMELEILFDEWLKLHKNESEESLGKTRYDEIEIDSFNRDGWLDLDAYMNAKKKILFVFKEPNLASPEYREEAGLPQERSQIGFYKEFVVDAEFDSKRCLLIVWRRNKEGNLERKYVDNNSRQKELVARMAWDLLNKGSDEDDSVILEPNAEELQKALNKVAFININKRGGLAKTEKYKLRAYYEKYEEQIIKEIEIIEPDIIVLLAPEIEDYLRARWNDKIAIINMCHTGCSWRMKMKNAEWNGRLLLSQCESKFQDCEQSVSRKERSLKFTRTAFKYMLEFRKRRRTHKI